MQTGATRFSFVVNAQIVIAGFFLRKFPYHSMWNSLTRKAVEDHHHHRSWCRYQDGLLVDGDDEQSNHKGGVYVNQLDWMAIDSPAFRQLANELACKSLMSEKCDTIWCEWFYVKTCVVQSVNDKELRSLPILLLVLTTIWFLHQAIVFWCSYSHAGNICFSLIPACHVQWEMTDCANFRRVCLQSANRRDSNDTSRTAVSKSKIKPGLNEVWLSIHTWVNGLAIYVKNVIHPPRPKKCSSLLNVTNLSV